MSEATRLLRRLSDGDEEAAEQLLPLVYGELHRLARQSMAKQRADHTLQPTALVHEAYLRLMDARDPGWNGRRHFLAVAARAMRTVLIDHARGRGAQKRGSGRRPLTLDEDRVGHDDFGELLALHDALEALARIDAPLAQMVELRFFGGLSVEDAADVLGVSPSTVKRGWRVAKAWLRRALDPESGDGVD